MSHAPLPHPELIVQGFDVESLRLHKCPLSTDIGHYNGQNLQQGAGKRHSLKADPQVPKLRSHADHAKC